MNKDLHDNVDDFFLNRLKNYTEPPRENLWTEIDRRLSEQEKNKPVFSTRKILSAAAIILACLLTPFLIIESNLNKQHAAETKPITNKNIEYKKLQPAETATNFSNKKIIIDDSSVTPSIQNNIVTPFIQDNIFSNKPTDQNFSIAEIPVYTLAKPNTEKEVELLPALNGLTIAGNIPIPKNNAGDNQEKPATVHFSQKHFITISPFFSADHISGRFVEQYEYDHENESDYQRREKPDFSFTLGALAQYRLNNKFSILSGLSFSNAGISISAAAVNALKDQTGAYKFKLATSYGLVEFSKSGITPTAGDTLLVTGATLNLQYISLPVLVKYNICARKFKLSAHGGIAVNKIMSDKVEADYTVQNNSEFETVNKIQGIKRVFFSINTGVEAGYPISRKIDLSVSPELRYGINSINKSTPVKTYPINYGLAVHLNIKL